MEFTFQSDIQIGRGVDNSLIKNLQVNVKTIGEDYFITGEYTALWEGEFSSDAGGVVKVVIKVLRGRSSSDYKSNDIFLPLLCRHASIWHGLNHPNVSPLFGLTFNGPFLALVLPYYSNGNIISYCKGNPCLSLEDMLCLIMEAVSGLLYLHDKRIVHGSIHGGNIMIDDKCHAILCDFGVHNLMRESREFEDISLRCRWMAPECFIETIDGGVPRPTAASDIYSTANTIVEVFTLTPPFPNVRKVTTLISKMQNGQLQKHEKPPQIPSSIWEILQDCWSLRPDTRPKSRELLSRLEVIKGGMGCGRHLRSSK